jgi:hypothetical protein
MENAEKRLQLILGIKVDPAQARAASEQISKVTSPSGDLTGYLKLLEAEFKKRGIKLGQTFSESIQKGLTEDQAADLFINQMREQLSLLERSTEEIRTRQKELKSEAQILNQLSERAQKYSRAFTILGGAITGGFVAAAFKYIGSADKSDAISKKWLATSKELEKSQQEIGRIAAQTVLPIYQKVAQVMEIISRIAQANPEAAKTLFGAGVALTLIGILGSGISRGIRLVADAKLILASSQQLLASVTMSKAAKDQLIAAGLMQKGGFLGLLQKGGLLTAAGGATALGTGLAIAGGVTVGAAVNDAIVKATGKGATTAQFLTVGALKLSKVFEEVAIKFGTPAEEARHKSEVFVALVGKLTGAMDENHPLWQKVTEAVKKASEALSDVEKSTLEWQREDRKLVEDAYQKRLMIVAAYQQKENQLIANYRSQQSQVSSQFDSQLKTLLQNYAVEVARAEEAYEQERASIIRESSTKIQDIERDHQKAMVQLTKDHNQRVADLVASRDALGLIKEQRRFAEEKSQAEQSINETIAREKEETALRLQELSRRHQQERIERERAFLEQRKEISRQRAQSMSELRNSYLAELAQLRQAKSLELLELQRALDAERRLKREQYEAIIRDLGGTPAPNSTTSSSSGVTYTNPYDIRSRGYARGGYASGLIRTGEEGIEFVMSHSTTRAAEKVIGGSLTQESLLNALAGRSITIMDQRKFESVPSPWDRKKMNDEMREVIREVINGRI